MAQEDESELFRTAVADAEPLQSDRREPFRKRLRPLPIEQPEEPLPAEVFSDCESVKTQDELLFRRPGIQERLMRELRRGQVIPEDSLDLHGLRVEEARRQLRDFLNQALLRRYRCVRIIHGKGRGSSSQQPVLKQKVNQWLPQLAEVLAFGSAPRRDGGLGAVYVLLKRYREAIDQ